MRAPSVDGCNHYRCPRKRPSVLDVDRRGMRKQNGLVTGPFSLEMGSQCRADGRFRAVLETVVTQKLVSQKRITIIIIVKKPDKKK